MGVQRQQYDIVKESMVHNASTQYKRRPTMKDADKEINHQGHKKIIHDLHFKVMAARAHPQNMELESRQSVVHAHGIDRDM